MNERYTRLRAAVDAAVKRGDVGGDYRTYDVGSLLCDYDALAARLAAVEKYIIVLARLRRWLKEGAVLRATDPSKPVLEDVDGYFHGGITVSYESEAEKARLAEALASEERTQRLWDEAEARLAEAEIGHARYEYVRRLNVNQFRELFVESLHGARFDDLVDAARATDSATVGQDCQTLAALDSEDAARFRWLCDDHADKATRHLRDSLLERMSVMSLSAIRAAIGIHLSNVSEQAKNSHHE